MPPSSTSGPTASVRGRGRFGWWWVLGALGLLALAVRLAPWRAAFTPTGITFLVDTDPHYHVMRAQRILSDLGQVPLFDGGMNYPYGTRILWPPLFDYLIAVPAWMLGGTTQDLYRVAAVLSPVLGAVTVVLVAVLAASVLGRRAGLLAGLLVALLPLHATFTVVGRPDQHSAELLLCTWAFAAFAAGLRSDDAGRSPWGPAVSMGAALALSFWNWQGSALYLLVPSVFVAAWWVVGPEPQSRRAARTLARAAVTGAGLLAVSLAVLLPGEIALLSGKGVTGFHVLLLAAVASFAGGLGWLGWLGTRRGQTSLRRRLLEALLAAAVPAALALWVGRAGFATNLAALGAANRWYETISEFWPLFGRGWYPLERNLRHVLATYGLTLFFMPLAGLSLLARWRRERSAQLAFVLAWGLVLLVMTLVRRRIGEYLLVPMVLWVAAALDALPAWLGARPGKLAAILAPAAPFLGALLLLAPVLPTLTVDPPAPDRDGDLREPMALLRGEAPRPGREAVLSVWSAGHFIRFFGGRPVVTSPFGVDGGDEAMRDAARFFLARDERAAEEVLRERHVGYVLLKHPGSEVYVLSGFAPPSGPAPVEVRHDWYGGDRYDIRPAFWDLVPSRLYFLDGGASAATGALGGFRLVYESPPDRPDLRNAEQYKMFETVAGAALVVAGLSPNARVVATVQVVTHQGRRFAWETSAVADGSGEATLRVPYATGRGTHVAAGPVLVTDGERRAVVPVPEEAVVEGRRVPVSLGGVPRE